jgi:hypothetical protein
VSKYFRALFFLLTVAAVLWVALVLYPQLAVMK